jgi:hypothetical protein
MYFIIVLNFILFVLLIFCNGTEINYKEKIKILKASVKEFPFSQECYDAINSDYQKCLSDACLHYNCYGSSKDQCNSYWYAMYCICNSADKKCSTSDQQSCDSHYNATQSKLEKDICRNYPRDEFVLPITSPNASFTTGKDLILFVSLLNFAFIFK